MLSYPSLSHGNKYLFSSNNFVDLLIIIIVVSASEFVINSVIRFWFILFVRYGQCIHSLLSETGFISLFCPRNLHKAEESGRKFEPRKCSHCCNNFSWSALLRKLADLVARGCHQDSRYIFVMVLLGTRRVRITFIIYLLAIISHSASRTHYRLCWNVKLYLSLQRKKIDWGCLRTGWWGKHLYRLQGRRSKR